MEESKRFFRTEILLGREGFNRFTHSDVIIFGLGAVGYTAAEMLVRMGLINLTLVDCDIIEESDFNRHLLGVKENIGRSKVEASLIRLKSINNKVNISGRNIFFHRDTLDEILNKRYDFLIDAIDSLSPKVELIKCCLKNNQPFISSMGAARRTDPSLVRISRINEGKKCPLLRHIKTRLRKDGFTDDFPVVYSEEDVKGDIVKGQDMYYTRGRIRDILPSSVLVTTTFGIHLAWYTINTILSDYKINI